MCWSQVKSNTVDFQNQYVTWSIVCEAQNCKFKLNGSYQFAEYMPKTLNFTNKLSCSWEYMWHVHLVTVSPFLQSFCRVGHCLLSRNFFFWRIRTTAIMISVFFHSLYIVANILRLFRDSPMFRKAINILVLPSCWKITLPSIKFDQWSCVFIQM